MDYFRAAVGDTGKVMAADASPLAPALYGADRWFVVPSADDAGHVGALLEVCREQQISLLISVNDLELPSLAAHRAAFASVGTRVLVSDPQVIATCHDKLATAAFLLANGIVAPRTAVAAEAPTLIANGELALPLAVKPRHGSASVGFEVVDSLDELDAVLALVRARARRGAGEPDNREREEVVVQPFVTGDEYGLDVLNDLAGNHAATVVKKKLAMRAGETDRAVTVADDRLADLGAALGRALGHVGVLDCDVIVSRDGPVVLDLNPRFGGGYPFSHRAGIDMPSAILAWLAGRQPDPAWLSYQPGIASAKYDLLMPVPAPGGLQA